MRLFGTISTKNTLAFVLLMVACIHSYSQKTFSSVISPQLSLDGAAGSCAAPGITTPNVFSVSVIGVGTASSTNQLLLISIELNDCGTGSKNLNEVQIRIMSPSGVCKGIYDGGLSTVATGTHQLNLVSSTACLNNPNTSNDLTEGAGILSSGNNGYYNAKYSGVGTIYDFAGSLDGTWKLIFSETTVSPACIKSIRLVFGDPTITVQPNDGQTCATPLIWNGKSPICTGTLNTISGSDQMPGSLLGNNTNSFGTIGGVTCQWNSANNNDIWIKYTATTTNTCLAVSGISGVNITLQSIVVTDANADNDNNPCTQIVKTATDDPNWQVVSCPRPSIYSTTAGTQKNQQHCFSSVVGKDYYLVVDGDGGAASKFWIYGSTATTLQGLLPANSFDLTGLRSGNANVLEWLCTSDKPVVAYFVQRSYDRTDFQPIARQEGMQTGTSKRQFKDPLSLRENYYYRIKAELADGMFIYSNIIQLRGGSQNSITAFPNPVKDVLHVSTPNKIDHINIFNAQGQLIFTEIRAGLQSLRIPTISWEPGQYILVVTDMQGNTETMKVVK